MRFFRKLISRIIILAVLIVAADIYIEVNYPYCEYVQFQSAKINDSIKILSIADLHSKEFGRDNERLLNLIRQCNFDAIVCNGDIVDINSDQLPYIEKFFSMLMKFNKPVFYVSGNNEKWENWEEITTLCENMGVNVLRNENATVTRGSTTVNLCGIDDYNTKEWNLDSALDGINPNNFTVLISHTPDILYEEKAVRSDLVLSGHTHGGQVTIPFLKDYIQTGKKCINDYIKGTYQFDDSTTLYIDSGMGTTKIPMRFGNRSKVTLITLKNNM